MNSARLQRGNTLRTAWMLVFWLLAAVPFFAQDAPVPETVPPPVPQPVAGEPNLFRLEGVDPESGHYIRLLLLKTSDTPTTEASTSEAPPRLTFECVEKDGKRDVRMYVSFGGIKDMSFTPPFHPKPGVPYKLIPTDVKLKMRFVGYINWKPYVESWRLMDNGEYRYRDSGWHSPNMESIPFVLKMLNSLPGLRIVHETHVPNDPGEVFFQTQPLLDELKKTPLCNP
ncbi:MAG: hypothetical protein ABR987_22460 [Terracidiphilus sp.]